MKTENKVIFERTVVDHENSTILSQEFIHKRGSEPAFIKLYLDCLCDFKGLSKSLNPILLEFLKYMTYANIQENNGGQIIYLNAEMKRQIAIATGKTVKRVEQAITDFVKTGVFKRIATGTYQVNGNLFGKGDWKDIKNIRATFDFGKGEMQAEIIKKNDEESNNELVANVNENIDFLDEEDDEPLYIDDSNIDDSDFIDFEEILQEKNR